MKGKHMKTTTTKRTSLKLALVAPLALTALVAAPHARADSILLAQTTLVAGTESTVDSFSTSTTGTVSIDLQTLNWPAPLSALSFSATTGSSLLSNWLWTGQGSSSDVMTFDVGAGTYFTHVMATAAAASMDLGLYSMLLTFSPTSSRCRCLPAAGCC